MRGSGTSQAAAVVSGEAALLLQAKPDLTPDQVKQVLMGTANGLNNVSTLMEGAGTTDLRKALGSVPRNVANPAPWGTGTGSLEASRGSFHIVVGRRDRRGDHAAGRGRRLRPGLERHRVGEEGQGEEELEGRRLAGRQLDRRGVERRR